jgi:molybdopterin-guanine dinucleotide biosynthesis protein A
MAERNQLRRRLGPHHASDVRHGKHRALGCDIAGRMQRLRHLSRKRHPRLRLGGAMRRGLPQIVDSYDAVGPVAGILSAQDRYPDAAWLVLACDLPLLDATTLEQLIEARDATADAAVFTSSHDGLPEPLCAIWEPSSHALLKQRYEAGSYCPRKALSQSRIVLLPAPGAALDNVNTPEEREAMQQRLESLA